MKPIITILLLAIIVSSCSKDGGPILDEEAPSIYIFAPETGSIINAGKDFHLQADLAENQLIHQVYVMLRSDSLGFEVTIMNEHLDTQVLKIDQMVTAPQLPAGTYDLIVAAVDHDDNHHESTVPVVLE